MEKYRLVISEPWDYIGPFGDNSLRGKVTTEISLTCLIFESDREVTYQDVHSKYFILTSRYQGCSLKEKEIFKGTVGVGILKIDSFVGLDRANLMSNADYCFIGSLEKVDRG